MTTKTPRRFEFDLDTFAFANELLWEYRPDPATGAMSFKKRQPRPDYAHRCFVLARAARQFLYHARFAPQQPAADDETCRMLVRRVLAGNPRVPSAKPLEIPGFSCLREFSRAREKLLKAACGGAWRSYVLRSHWRMLFPLSRRNQNRASAKLLAGIQNGFSPIVHLVTFPSLTINHGMILFDGAEIGDEVRFSAYDPNRPAQPAQLLYQRSRRTFWLPPNEYWAGGALNVIEIFRNWIL
ncbi:MAG: hypothetical protein KGR98_02210 [Verrucomicrobia bacterium]|nr:hypothetical protein [Verrucomicrobiota bacterium]MDE3098382.1 hypothetical protein [Verrucomicrobiota bacterium]